VPDRVPDGWWALSEACLREWRWCVERAVHCWAVEKARGVRD